MTFRGATERITNIFNMIHELKTWPEYFQLIESGEKSFELRKNDRDFKVGDHVLLKEYQKDSKQYTGRILNRRITFVMKGIKAEELGLKKGYCIMSIEEV